MEVPQASLAWTPRWLDGGVGCAFMTSTLRPVLLGMFWAVFGGQLSRTPTKGQAVNKGFAGRKHLSMPTTP